MVHLRWPLPAALIGAARVVLQHGGAVDSVSAATLWAGPATRGLTGAAAAAMGSSAFCTPLALPVFNWGAQRLPTPTASTALMVAGIAALGRRDASRMGADVRR